MPTHLPPPLDRSAKDAALISKPFRSNLRCMTASQKNETALEACRQVKGFVQYPSCRQRARFFEFVEIEVTPNKVTGRRHSADDIDHRIEHILRAKTQIESVLSQCHTHTLASESCHFRIALLA